VTKIGELGTTQAATSNRRMLRSQVPPKRRFLQEPHGVTTQKTPFFMVLEVVVSETALAYHATIVTNYIRSLLIERH
jgi:hypothetical protein